MRLSGAAEDIEIIALMLAGIVIERSAPYANRSDLGVRVYLTALIANAAPDGQSAADDAAGG